MSGKTTNHGLIQLELNDNANFPQLLNDTFKTVDKGLTLDVGTSTGTGNNYILDIGSITLAEGNKGISFKFFADKDSTGAVTINTNYNLIKANKNEVKNLKSGAPYIITYDGGSNFFLASGSDESDSTSVGTDGSNVLAPNTFIGTDGEVHTGTMVNRGAVSATLGINGTYTISKGYHNGNGKVAQNITTLGAKTYTPTTSNQTIASGQYLSGIQTIKGDANLIASNIISGKSIFGVAGNATIESLGGKKYVTGELKKSPNPTTIDFGSEILVFCGVGYPTNGATGKPIYDDYYIALFANFDDGQGTTFVSTYNTINSTKLKVEGTKLTISCDTALSTISHFTYYAILK